MPDEPLSTSPRGRVRPRRPEGMTVVSGVAAVAGDAEPLRERWCAHPDPALPA